MNGILRLRGDAAQPSRDELRRSRDYMERRGPDGAGEWLAPSGEIALGHRRLAIIDLSDAARQPMCTHDGRYWIVFNGEIYNYRELRASLASAYPFRSHSDTEVILALFARDGIDGLKRLRGMFALAIWDELARRLLLARDPNGIKPLYYSSDGRHFRFASQVKALVAGGAISTRHDPDALRGFLLWGAVPEPRTIYESIRAVPAGHSICVTDGTVERPTPLPSDDSKPDTDFLEAMRDTVAAHLVSDVPVAVFLSAGLDSSLVAALAAAHGASPLVTVTLRFREFLGTPDDEGPLAAKVANMLGARHVERWVSREEFMSEWEASIRAMDQPSIDGFNTYWVAKSAREAGIKVALSGLGGDELLGGYPSFRQVPKLRRYVGIARRVPGLRRVWPHLARRCAPSTPKLRGLLEYGASFEGAYFLRRAVFLPEDLAALPSAEGGAPDLVEGMPALTEASRNGTGRQASWEIVHRLESGIYLRNQLLRDSDWASMAHSVELRVPLVDDRLQRSAAASRFELPRTLGKAGVVRQLVPRLPPDLLDRAKTGFLIPAAVWLSGAQSTRMRGDSRRLALRVLEAFGLPAAEGLSRTLEEASHAPLQ